MKFLPLLLLFFAGNIDAQNTIEWDGKYQLQLSDFASPATQVGSGNVYSLHTVSGPEFAFYMSNAEFMFTKNFNAKVSCNFKRDAAVLTAPDSDSVKYLIDFARFEFDLSELYARKLRKKLYEEKQAFSNVSYMKPLSEENQAAYAKQHGQASQITDLGRKTEKLSELHQMVLQEIETLSDFCKNCKPSKKKK